MISFFQPAPDRTYAIEASAPFHENDIEKLTWLFGNARLLDEKELTGPFIGPRREMITPWSTNAVEITRNMGIEGIVRIEEFHLTDEQAAFDPMLQVKYPQLDQKIFAIERLPEPILAIEDIASYNEAEGLALSDEEVTYLEGVSAQLGRKLTDGEVFGFSQVNSEHCRHKIFNGTFIIDGQEQEHSLFQWIKKTTLEHPNKVVSAYKDNVAFVSGPKIEQFAPKAQDRPDYFQIRDIDSILSLKAETHNFPTTVEPFNGAATGSGGEIRDRLAGGQGSLPLAGTAVYMTSYTRLEKDRPWEKDIPARKWLYQSPIDILIKASDGASDFGNKFGQPLIAGSVLTFEHLKGSSQYGYDKVIMLAGGIGFANSRDTIKGQVKKGDKVVVLGGDNYRIGMGGGAVSSVATGEYGNTIELNAVQRSNPEMQKRVMNAIRAMQEDENNPIISIHDHGAGGHLNCLSELLEETGGEIEISKLPVGDPTLSDKEIIGNESQERMGLVIHEKDIDKLKRAAERERSPFYVVGQANGELNFKFIGRSGKNPIDWKLEHMFGSSPRTVLTDTTQAPGFNSVPSKTENITYYIEQVLQLEAVACKDWLTNKVDRSVTGKVATQQTCGEVQLPLNNLGVMALDFNNHKGVATSIGHAPVASMIDPVAGAYLAIAESLTNLIWAPLTYGLKGVSLSANWMWPAKVNGENARLYKAVKAVSDFACDLGINIPTGKDSLSMTQKYPDGTAVHSPGTVIISTIGEVSDIRKTVTPDLKPVEDTFLYHIDFTTGSKNPGGSSFSQVVNQIGDSCPQVADAQWFSETFGAIQNLINEGEVLAGHDIGSGGLITSLLEMCFPSQKMGMKIDLDNFSEDLSSLLFAENPGIIMQMTTAGETLLNQQNIAYVRLGQITTDRSFTINYRGDITPLNIDQLRDVWYKTSYLLDSKQRGKDHAIRRYNNYKEQPLEFTFPTTFQGLFKQYGIDPKRREATGIKAAIIREKGVNGDREMAYSLYLAGFDVKDVHMTDLISGREDLTDVNFIVFVGGFSNSDVLGSAKGWAGAFLYNQKARESLNNFYKRDNTLSLGVCNGCQLMMELGLIYPKKADHPRMQHNSSHKFESAFISVSIPENNAVMLKSLAGSKLGVWLAHGEGRFDLAGDEDQYNIVVKYAYSAYPGNPNGSDHDAAAVCSADGRHLAIMPHLERSVFTWNWPYYAEGRTDEVSPWIEAFVNARDWISEQ